MAFSEKDVNIEDYKKLGSGEAPDNTCGAVYASLLLLDEKQQEDFKQEFKTQTGCLKCHELKKEWKVPCKDCVRISAEILESITQPKHRFISEYQIDKSCNYKNSEMLLQ